jgi:hypothetical protein
MCACAVAELHHPDAGGGDASADAGAIPDAAPEATVSDGASDAATADANNPDLACAATATQDQCISCCETNHPAAGQLMNQALFDCACTSSVCGTECASSFCINYGTSSTCLSCLEPTLTGICEKPMNDTCAANPDCTAWEACSVPCPSKPP